MRIALLFDKLTRFAGDAKYALAMSRELVGLGHEVDVWAIEYDKVECHPDLTRGIHIGALRTVHSSPMRPRHTFGIGMITYLAGLLASYRDQVRLSRMIPRGYDLINAHGNHVSWAAVEYKRRLGAPVVWMCNDFFPPASHRSEVALNLRARVKRSAKEQLCLPFNRYDRTIVSEIDKIAVLSERVKYQMQNYYRVNPCVIRAGVDDERFATGDGSAIRQRYAAGPSFLLLTVCSLLPRRRIEDVIRAVRILVSEGCDVKYLVAGQTSRSLEYGQFLQAELSSSNLSDRVTFVGEVSYEELGSYYHACDAFIWAADGNQSWGLAALEAMAAGRPTIVSRANGLAEVLEDGRSALVIPPRSPEAIADSIRRLMGNPALAKSIASQGRRLVSEKYTWRKNGEAMLELFKEAINNKIGGS